MLSMPILRSGRCAAKRTPPHIEQYHCSNDGPNCHPAQCAMHCVEDHSGQNRNHDIHRARRAGTRAHIGTSLKQIERDKRPNEGLYPNRDRNAGTRTGYKPRKSEFISLNRIAVQQGFSRHACA